MERREEIKDSSPIGKDARKEEGENTRARQADYGQQQKTLMKRKYRVRY
jgi:hypothetical protein